MKLKPFTNFELYQVIETELWTLNNTIKADHPRMIRRAKRSSKAELEAGFEMAVRTSQSRLEF